MDQKKLSIIVAEVFKSLTPSVIQISNVTADTATVRVVSNSFKGLTTTARIALLCELFEMADHTLFNQRVYLFEAFTSEEATEIFKGDTATSAHASGTDLKQSASTI